MVVVHVGAMKMYVAAVKEKWKTMWNSVYHKKNQWFFEFALNPPPWMLMYLFCKFFKKISLLMTKLSVMKQFFLIL